MLETIKKLKWIAAIVLVAVFLSFNLLEENDAGETLVIQDVTGGMRVIREPGPCWQGWGTVTHYHNSNQFKFSTTEDDNPNIPGITTRFNDGGHGTMSGVIRWYIPASDLELIALHKDYRGEDAITSQLIAPALTNAIFLTGPLMSSQESNASKKNDLMAYVEDQTKFGTYRTTSKDVKAIDPITNTEKTTNVVTIVLVNGVPKRQDMSLIKKYNIPLNGLAINKIDYDKSTEKQLQEQQTSVMMIQTAIANSKKAEQDALTTELQGKASAAEAKWKQEVIKATLVTKAESDKAVAELAVQTANLNKQRDILEGEGIAAKKRLVMQADGALTQKLATYEKVQKFWSTAFQNYTGALVPTYVSGGASTGNAGFNFMELMGAKAAKDLGLSLENSKK